MSINAISWQAKDDQSDFECSLLGCCAKGGERKPQTSVEMPRPDIKRDELALYDAIRTPICGVGIFFIMNMESEIIVDELVPNGEIWHLFSSIFMHFYSTQMCRCCE